MRTRLTVLALLLALQVPAGRAAPSDLQYVVVAAIGKQITIVRPRAGMGAPVGAVSRETVPIADTRFEDAVLDAAERALRTVQGPAAAAPLRVRVGGALVDETTFELAPAALERLMDALEPSIADAARARVIVVAPLAAPLQFPVRLRSGPQTHGNIGQGTQAGLGYYVDIITPVEEAGTNARNQGFLAVYANLQLILIDAAQRTVIARETATDTELYLPSTKGKLDPWEALAPGEKIDALRALVAGNVSAHLLTLVRAEK